MNVLVLHNVPGDNAAVAEQDVRTQRDAVVVALESLGYEVSTFGCTLDLDAVRRRLLDDPPDVVFNLVESLADTDRLMPLAPLLLDALNIPYTGASSAAMLATSNKLLAKKLLRESGLPTPDCVPPDGGPSPMRRTLNSRWIIKPVWEHASAGMDDEAVLETGDEGYLLDQLIARQRQFRRPLFAEKFIDGREFNLSLLVGDVLPPAEIDFGSFPPGKPRIVGQRAKWEVDSFEYQRTPRRFVFPASDDGLLESLAELSRRCWELFGLSGFARVDFRVDSDNQPWILEVNVNPCLSPDAGFAAALGEAGISYDEGVRRIASEALRPFRESISSA